MGPLSGCRVVELSGIGPGDGLMIVQYPRGQPLRLIFNADAVAGFGGFRGGGGFSGFRGGTVGVGRGPAMGARTFAAPGRTFAPGRSFVAPGRSVVTQTWSILPSALNSTTAVPPPSTKLSTSLFQMTLILSFAWSRSCRIRR